MHNYNPIKRVSTIEHSHVIWDMTVFMTPEQKDAFSRNNDSTPTNLALQLRPAFVGYYKPQNQKQALLALW